MRIGVIGGGRMGAGIAQVFLGIGAEVVLVEAGAAAATVAGERVRAGLAKAAERGSLTEPVEADRFVVSAKLGGAGDARRLLGLALRSFGLAMDFIFVPHIVLRR